jgi:phosphoribosyl 1,2-cyclic phosphodiesterase
MKLTVINSNSAGNAYILQANDGQVLLIECGVRFDRIKQALQFNLSRVEGCLISHDHQDHCKSVRDVLGAGIQVHASCGTHKAMGTYDHHRSIKLEPNRPFYLGHFQILPFDVKHDAAEPFGYLIQHPECGTVLFLTDSYYSEYVFKGLNNIIVEANYCQSILDRRVKEGENPVFLRDRVITSHMSLATCKELLKANDLSKVNNIVLIHLSDGNSDARRFKKEVQEATGKTVHVAEPGLSIDFNIQPF